MKDLNVFCGWGDGPDVGINLNPPAYRVLTGGLAIIDLTADQALEMADELRNAALAAKKLDEECQRHDERAPVAEGHPPKDGP